MANPPFVHVTEAPDGFEVYDVDDMDNESLCELAQFFPSVSVEDMLYITNRIAISRIVTRKFFDKQTE